MWSTEVFSTMTDIQFVPGSSPRACLRCWREQRSTYRSATLASYVGRPCRWTPPTSSSLPQGLSMAWTASSVAGRRRRWVVGRGLCGVGSWYFSHTMNRYMFGGQGAWGCRIVALLSHNELLMECVIIILWAISAKSKWPWCFIHSWTIEKKLKQTKVRTTWLGGERGC